MPIKTALLVIAAGEKYREYAKKLIASADEFFVPHDTVVFTDNVVDFASLPGVIPILYSYRGYPDASYRRYHAIVDAAELLLMYNYVYYVDSDMVFVAPVTGEEIFSDGVTATEHPGYVGTNGTPETNPLSTAYCPIVRNYFCGGFNGGKTSAFLKMALEIKLAIETDDRNKIQAAWVDEAHTNHFLFYNPPAKILSPAFCYPENAGQHYKDIWRRANRTFEPKLMALEKGSR